MLGVFAAALTGRSFAVSYGMVAFVEGYFLERYVRILGRDGAPRLVQAEGLPGELASDPGLSVRSWEGTHDRGPAASSE